MDWLFLSVNSFCVLNISFETIRRLNMLRFVEYRRVSTQTQGKSGLGLEAQKTILENYYKTLDDNIEVIADFVEIQSGKKLVREELEKAVALSKKKNATLVIAKLDRLARSVFFISRLMQTGVKFIVAESPNDDTFTLHIKASLAEEEGRKISERVRQSLAEWKKRNPNKKLGNPNYNMGDDNKKRADGYATTRQLADVKSYPRELVASLKRVWRI